MRSILKIKSITNKSIWTTYILLLLASVLISGVMMYVKWVNLEDEIFASLHHKNALISQSIESELQKTKSILTIIGHHLVEQGIIKDVPVIEGILTRHLKDNPGLVAFELFGLDGKLLASSNNIDRAKAINLFEAPEAKGVFKQAVREDRLVIAHTNYSDSLNKWVIPILYNVKDSSNKTIAIISTSLDASPGNNLWASNHLPDNFKFIMFRNDRYRQYHSHLDWTSMSLMYGKIMPNYVTEALVNNIRQYAGVDLDAVRNSGNSYSIITIDKDSDKVLVVLQYNTKYDYFTATYITQFRMVDAIVPPLVCLLLLLLFFNTALYVIFQRINQMQNKSRHKLQYQAEHDELTGLSNRYCLKAKFNEYSDKYNQVFSMLYIDLDNFKTANDVHGHSKGDMLLKQVAIRIKFIFSDSVVVRMGGDEFIVLSPYIDRGQLYHVCNNFIEAVKQPIIVDGIEFMISASVGIAIAPDHGNTLDDLLRKSDMAMYEAKQKQHKTYVFSDDLESKTHRIMSIETELKHALDNNEFKVVYQPQIDSRTNEVVGVEALIRWHNSRLGFVSPDEFIPIAETTGLINDIGIYVLRTAISDTSSICEIMQESEKNHAQSFINKRLSINVSVKQLLSDAFIEVVTNEVHEHLCSKFKVMFEVTENLFIDDVDKARQVLNEIRALGVSISMDDFGTGYSSLHIINELPLDELKIDKSFIFNMSTHKTSLSLVESIISIAHNLGIPVVAEGVEHEDHVHILSELGCDIFQGYFFAKPLHKEELMNYLQNRS